VEAENFARDGEFAMDWATALVLAERSSQCPAATAAILPVRKNFVGHDMLLHKVLFLTLSHGKPQTTSCLKDALIGFSLVPTNIP